MASPPTSPCITAAAVPASPSVSATSSFKQIDPYLIHPNDSPTTVFYSPLLNGDNYPSWLRGITKALNAKGKLCFVDGSLPPPTDPNEKACWKRCDDLVVSWITNSCETDIRSSCLYADSAYTIWKDLHVRFSQANAPKLYHLKTAISSLKQEDKSVTVYYTRLKTLWDELDTLNPPETCICGASKFLIEQHARDRAMEFLQGLYDRYTPIRSQILLIEPIPTAEKMFNLVKQEEMQQLINNSTSPMINPAIYHSHADRNHYVAPPQLHSSTMPSVAAVHSAPLPPSSSAPLPPSPSAPLPSSPSTQAFSFTPEQYHQLLSFLKAQQQEDDSAPRVNLAGPFLE